MMNMKLKVAAAGALALLSNLALADSPMPFSLSSTDGAARVEQIAHPGFTITFVAPFEIMGGALALEWLPGSPVNALELVRDDLSIAGLSGAALANVLDPDFTRVELDANGRGLTFFAAPSLANPSLPILSGEVAVGLGLIGHSAGNYAVQYTLTLVDSGGVEYPVSDHFSVTITPVPEPATYALMLGGLAVVGALARRRSRAA